VNVEAGPMHLDSRDTPVIVVFDGLNLHIYPMLAASKRFGGLGWLFLAPFAQKKMRHYFWL